MVQIDEEGQVIISLGIILAFLIIGISTGLYMSSVDSGRYIEETGEKSSYYFYNIREAYGRALELCHSESGGENPFSSEMMERFEERMIRFAGRRGYILAFMEKHYYSDREVAEVKIVFSGRNTEFIDEVEYDL